MRKLLIADSSEPFTNALKNAFRGEFDIRICQDGKTALELLASFCPDALILNLMLPFKDGLTVLQETAYVPPAVLALTNYSSDYIVRAAAQLGVDYILTMPCVNAVCVRLLDLLQQSPVPKRKSTPQNETAVHLHILNFTTRRDGYQQLCAGIPLFSRDPNQRLTKELYPAVAELCGSKDGRAVEHSIRCAIETAWKSRDDAVWAKYFPQNADGNIPCPSNKTFISRLAELLDIQSP